MSYFLGDRIYKRSMSRRDFLWLVSASTAGVSIFGSMAGCAVDPAGPCCP